MPPLLLAQFVRSDPPSPALLSTAGLVILIGLLLGAVLKVLLARKILPAAPPARVFASSFADALLVAMVFAILIVTGSADGGYVVWGFLVFLIMDGLLNLVAMGPEGSAKPWTSLVLPLPVPFAIVVVGAVLGRSLYVVLGGGVEPGVVP